MKYEQVVFRVKYVTVRKYINVEEFHYSIDYMTQAQKQNDSLKDVKKDQPSSHTPSTPHSSHPSKTQSPHQPSHIQSITQIKKNPRPSNHTQRTIPPKRNHLVSPIHHQKTSTKDTNIILSWKPTNCQKHLELSLLTKVGLAGWRWSRSRRKGAHKWRRVSGRCWMFEDVGNDWKGDVGLEVSVRVWSMHDTAIRKAPMNNYPNCPSSGWNAGLECGIARETFRPAVTMSVYLKEMPEDETTFGAIDLRRMRGGRPLGGHISSSRDDLEILGNRISMLFSSETYLMTMKKLTVLTRYCKYQYQITLTYASTGYKIHIYPSIKYQ